MENGENLRFNVVCKDANELSLQNDNKLRLSNQPRKDRFRITFRLYVKVLHFHISCHNSLEKQRQWFVIVWLTFVTKITHSLALGQNMWLGVKGLGWLLFLYQVSRGWARVDTWVRLRTQGTGERLSSPSVLGWEVCTDCLDHLRWYSEAHARGI